MATIVYNALLLLAFVGLVVYSAILATGNHWEKATYFLLIGVFLFSLFEWRARPKF
jgi:hypothetical protein